MDNSVESDDAFAFKIDPNHMIPATAIQRSGNSPAFRGGFGDVWKCHMSTQPEARPIAVKSIRILDSLNDVTYVTRTTKMVRRMAYVWIQLLHDNILPLEGVTEGFGPFPAFISPWMENGTLDDYLKQKVGLSLETKLSMVRDVAAGLQYLHDKDIVHGNLSATKVLVSGDGRLCLADYGLSMIFVDSSNNKFNACHMGNVRWMAPEVFEARKKEDEDEQEDEQEVQEQEVQEQEVQEVQEVQEEQEAVAVAAAMNKPTKASDVYSYGCIMMQVFSGRQPYARITNVLAVMRALQEGREPFSQLGSISEEIQWFAQLCLSRNMEHRPSVGKIVEFLWSQTNTGRAAKIMLSQLPFNVTQILQAVFTKCDYHPDGSDGLGADLKCKWVVLGSNKSEVAVKTSRDDVNSQDDVDKVFDRIRREMYVRKTLRHKTILALYGMTEGFGILPCFVHPWMAGGSLHDYVKQEYSNLSRRRKLDILLDVAQGITYLHKQDVVHGNLTGDNVLLDSSGRVRIADFSHSVIVAEADSRIFSERLPGDARYTAPESIPAGGRTGTPKPTKEGDVYSYGCITTLVLSGKVPYWWISEESQILSEKENGRWPFHSTVEIDEVHLNLVQQCLSAEKSRPSIEKVLYLILVQGFGAADLTNLVKRLNKTHQNVGSFGNVHRCKLYRKDIDVVQQAVSRYQSPSMSTSVNVAVKEIILGDHENMPTIINRLFREITLWLRLKHMNIVPLLGVADGFGTLPAFVSPWLENGALTGYLQRNHRMLSYNQKFALLEDVARGLQYLHSQSIIHGDLSGNNVLINKDGTACLVDFGLSAFLPDRMSQALLSTNHICTVPYMAPEYLIFDDEDNISPVLTPKSDVYAFGGIMLQVLEGKVPYYYIQKPAAIINCISRGQTPKRPLAPIINDSDWNFIQTCWSRDLEHRPSDEDILKFVEGAG